MSEALREAMDALRRRGCTRDTLASVRSTARLLLKHSGVELEETTQGEVDAFLASYSEKAPATQAAHATRLRILFASLGSVKLAAPQVRPTRSRGRRSPPQRVLAVEEVQELLRVSADPSRYRRKGDVLALRDRACLELLYGLGIRRSEAGGARVQDLRLADGSLVVKRLKGGGLDSLPLPRPSLESLRRYLAEGRPVLARGPKAGSDHLLLSHRGGPLGGAGVWRVLERVGRAAGITVRPHDCRRSVATHLVCGGVSVEVVRRLLGHADLGTTARYVRLGKEELRRAVGFIDHLPDPSQGSVKP